MNVITIPFPSVFTSNYSNPTCCLSWRVSLTPSFHLLNLVWTSLCPLIPRSSSLRLLNHSCHLPLAFHYIPFHSSYFPLLLQATYLLSSSLHPSFLFSFPSITLAVYMLSFFLHLVSVSLPSLLPFSFFALAASTSCLYRVLVSGSEQVGSICSLRGRCCCIPVYIK